MYAKLKGIELPYLHSCHSASLVIFIIGIVMCATLSKVPSWPLQMDNPALLILGIMGFAAFAIGAIAIISDSAAWLAVLGSAVLLKRFFATVRHLFF